MSKILYNFNSSKITNSGFTLVELLVVLIISTTVISLSTVAYNKLSTGAYLKSTARHIAASLRYARSYAVTRGVESSVLIDLKNRSYTYSGSGKKFKFKNGVDLNVFSAVGFGHPEGVAEIRFAPDGSSSGGKVTLSGKKKRYVVHVDWLTGQVGVGE